MDWGRGLAVTLGVSLYGDIEVQDSLTGRWGGGGGGGVCVYVRITALMKLLR